MSLFSQWNDEAEKVHLLSDPLTAGSSRGEICLGWAIRSWGRRRHHLRIRRPAGKCWRRKRATPSRASSAPARGRVGYGAERMQPSPSRFAEQISSSTYMQDFLHLRHIEGWQVGDQRQGSKMIRAVAAAQRTLVIAMEDVRVFALGPRF